MQATSAIIDVLHCQRLNGLVILSLISVEQLGTDKLYAGKKLYKSGILSIYYDQR